MWQQSRKNWWSRGTSPSQQNRIPRLGLSVGQVRVQADPRSSPISRASLRNARAVRNPNVTTDKKKIRLMPQKMARGWGTQLVKLGFFEPSSGNDRTTKNDRRHPPRHGCRHRCQPKGYLRGYSILDSVWSVTRHPPYAGTIAASPMYASVPQRCKVGSVNPSKTPFGGPTRT